MKPTKSETSLLMRLGLYEPNNSPNYSVDFANASIFLVQMFLYIYIFNSIFLLGKVAQLVFNGWW